MSRRRAVLLSLAVAAVVTVIFCAANGRADLTNFTPGDLVVMRGGDATYSQATYSNGEVPAYLDEYSLTVSGGTATTSYVGSYTIPTDTLTLPGINAASHEGRLELSGDGHYLDFVGYQEEIDPTYPRSTYGDAGVDGHDPTVRPPDPEYYQVGQVSGSGVFVHSALDTSVVKPQYVRAAYSNDGKEVWVGSKYPGAGLEYISNFGSSTIGDTTALQSSTDWRDVKVNAGQLYGGTGSLSVGTHGFYAIGSGEPTSGNPSNTLLGPNSDNSTSGFSFETLPGTQPIGGTAGNANTVYVVGDPGGTAYIGKLYSAGGTPLSQSNLTFASRQGLGGQISTPEAITTQVDPNNPAWVDLFVQNANGIYFAIDESGSSSGSFGTLSFTKIISTALDGSTNFYGLAFAPAPVLLKGDLNFDGHVDAEDVVAMEKALADLNGYISSESSNGVTSSNLASIADINGDGKVNNADLQALLVYLNDGNGSLIGVPEPSSLILICMGLAGVAGITHQRRRGPKVKRIVS